MCFYICAQNEKIVSNCFLKRRQRCIYHLVAKCCCRGC
uniref:Uncharacterized protein n=1 Tax=Anguilla anguilla TaxID=7936 RepID=A0A0E9S0D5_ANGAN